MPNLATLLQAIIYSTTALLLSILLELVFARRGSGERMAIDDDIEDNRLVERAVCLKQTLQVHSKCDISKAVKQIETVGVDGVAAALVDAAVVAFCVRRCAPLIRLAAAILSLQQLMSTKTNL